MKLSQLIRKRDVATATVATPATVVPGMCPSVAKVASVAVAIASVGKPETLQDRQREARRQKVIAMLEAAPDTQRAIYVDDASDPANIILAVAVRYPMGTTCEMAIPKAGYDPWRLLELIERHGQATHLRKGEHGNDTGTTTGSLPQAAQRNQIAYQFAGEQ